MDKFTFQCVHCFRDIEAPANMCGQVVACIFCNQDIRVPGLTEKTIEKEGTKGGFSLGKLILSLFFFMGVLFSIFFFIAGFAHNTSIGNVISVLSAILFFIIIASSAIINLLTCINEK